MFCQILVLFTILAVAFSSATQDNELHAATLMNHSFGKNTFIKSAFDGPTKLPTGLGGDAGLGNYLLQAMGYAENKCAIESDFFIQRISGGQCQAITDSSSSAKSQLLGCSPPSNGSTKFTLNMIQFKSANCAGDPFQVVAQYHDENDCDPIDDPSNPYKQSMRMKCIVPNESDKSAERGAYLTAFYSASDSTCEKALVLQGVLTDTCIKGTTTDDYGHKVPTNSSETITCATKENYVVHLYDEPGCQGSPSKTIPQPIKMTECQPGQQNDGTLAYEKQACAMPQ